MTTVYPTTTAPQPNGSGPRILKHVRVFTITQQTIDALTDPANAPIILHDAFNQRLAAGDPNAVAVKAAVDRWATIRDSAYNAYARRVGVPVAPARFHDLVEQLAESYRGPNCDHDRAAAIIAALGL